MIKLIKYISLFAVSFLLLTQVALAAEAEFLSKIQGCSKVPENDARLSCFDKLTNKEALDKIHIDAFAKEQIERTKEEQDKDINTIILTVSKLSKTVRGQWIIITENGQKWQQRDSARFNLKVNQKVIISKGSLGSTFLKNEDSNKRINVKRIK